VHNCAKLFRFHGDPEGAGSLTRDDPSTFTPPPAFGPFRVLHQIGVGALGPVFRTYEPTRDRLVAVKAFRLDITPEQAQALADELSRAADAGLFHPSIVEPIAAGVEGTLAYRAEEYVAAESLDVAMRHYAPATPDKVLPFITQIAGAIDFARAAGVGHGALHPRDIFVTPEEARASGFGVVEALERVGLRAPVRRPYSAPERIDGRGWGVGADVFSLAVITYELLTARRPSGLGAEIGPLTGAPIHAHADKLLAGLQRAMDADPARRFASALAFAGALEGAARGEAIAVPAPVRAPSIPAAAPVAAAVTTDETADEDDISPERDDDEAHHRWLMRERERAEAEPAPLFADEPEAEAEAEADQLLINAAAVAADDSASRVPFRDVPTEEALEEVEPRRRDFDSVYRVAPAVVPAQSSRMLPYAAILSLGLLVGFAVGYGVGSREPEADEPPVASATTSQPPSQTAPTTGPAGKAWSEQAVTTPPAPAVADRTSATPPNVPSETPEPAGSKPAPRPAATTGRLVVQSSPSRAGVTVNGEWRGRTPVLLERLPFGDYTVRVVQPGYVVSRQEVSLSAREPSRLLSMRLQRQGGRDTTRAASPPPTQPTQTRTPQSYSGSIYVDSRPQGARIFLDGRGVGVTPMTIPDVRIGSHVVRLELADHRGWSTTTRVASGQEVRVTGSLDRVR
jgi:protein kinase-like protein/PEGA domain-containing protein